MVTPPDPDAHGVPVGSRHGAGDGARESSRRPAEPPRDPGSTTDVPPGEVPSERSVDGRVGSPAGSLAVPPSPPSALTRPRRRTGRIVGAVAAALVVAFLVGAAFVPLPYYLFKPGSVRDTEPLIAVEGTEVYPSEGAIAYTTVSLRQATLLGLVRGWIDDDIDVIGRDQVLNGRDVDENRQFNLQLMSNSKQIATQVALERLGYDVDTTVGQVVVEVVPDTPADGALHVGDVITAIDGEPIDEAGDLARLLADDEPGDAITATVQALGDGAGTDVQLVLAESPDDPDQGVMGVGVSDGLVPVDYEFPFDVEIDTGDVGGPSAGLAFTLAIIDELTPGDLTGGSDVAVTGTIEEDGTVGQVGGTGQKAAAAREAGITLFLVPSADYRDAVDHAGDDLAVVAVDTVDEALAALGDRGGNVDDLPPRGDAAAGPVG